MNIGIIIPVYNEGSVIYDHFKIIHDTLKTLQHNLSFILINDGSSDRTADELNRIVDDYVNAQAIHFSRNFGKEIAICAGIDNLATDRYIIMDSDLQHPPKYIPDMLQLMDETGANIIDGVKSNRGKENIFYKLIANGFYKSLKTLTNLQMKDSSDFKIIDCNVANTIRDFSERNIFFRGIIDWVGFKRETFYFEVAERTDSQSSFSVKALAKLAVSAIFSYTSKPLLIPMLMGIIFFIASLALGIQTLYNYFSGNAVSGFSTVIILQLIIGSIIMFSLGIIGVYIARLYDEIKKRPRYIIRQHNKGK